MAVERFEVVCNGAEQLKFFVSNQAIHLDTALWFLFMFSPTKRVPRKSFHKRVPFGEERHSQSLLRSEEFLTETIFLPQRSASCSKIASKRAALPSSTVDLESESTGWLPRVVISVASPTLWVGMWDALV